MSRFVTGLARDVSRAVLATVVGGAAGTLVSALGSPRVLMWVVEALTGADGGPASPRGFGVNATPGDALSAVGLALALVVFYGAPIYRWLERRDLAGPFAASLVGAVPGIVLTWWFGGQVLGSAVVNPFVIDGVCIGLAYHLLASR